jgi:hypothetical protein
VNHRNTARVTSSFRAGRGRAVDTEFFLRANGNLTTAAPEAAEGTDTYVYDPTKPVE